MMVFWMFATFSLFIPRDLLIENASGIDCKGGIVMTDIKYEKKVPKTFLFKSAAKSADEQYVRYASLQSYYEQVATGKHIGKPNMFDEQLKEGLEEVYKIAENNMGKDMVDSIRGEMRISRLRQDVESQIEAVELASTYKRIADINLAVRDRFAGLSMFAGKAYERDSIDFVHAECYCLADQSIKESGVFLVSSTHAVNTTDSLWYLGDGFNDFLKSLGKP